MLLRRSAANFLPARKNLSALRRAAECCEGCDLHERAVQTVFGSGPRSADLMLVGEMPGDEEDRDGEPFVGPAGWLLDEALNEAGIERKAVYLTNCVKHFRWEPQQSRRLHKKPAARHLGACRPWLDAEIEVVQPAMIVCLGATAAQLLMGRQVRVRRDRGKLQEGNLAAWIMCTYHPSAILRAPHRADRDRMRQEFVGDLSKAHQKVADPQFS